MLEQEYNESYSFYWLEQAIDIFIVVREVHLAEIAGVFNVPLPVWQRVPR